MIIFNLQCSIFNSEAFGRGEATMRNKRKGYQSIYIPRQQKTVVSTKTDNCLTLNQVDTKSTKNDS